jgi:general secretion pathway protein G
MTGHERHPPRGSRARGGFTLIEIMAVVLIIGLLGTIVGTVVFSQIDRARGTTARAQLKQIEAALDFYRMDNGRYPTTEQGLEALVREPTIEPAPRDWRPEGYLQGGRLPVDPWGNYYQYLSPGVQNERSFDLWSYGSDGVEGGDGSDEDIGNWSEDVG